MTVKDRYYTSLGEGHEDTIEDGIHELDVLKTNYKFVSVFVPPESRPLDSVEYWFVNARDLIEARKELKKAVQRYIKAFPELVEEKARDLGMNLKQYQYRVLSGVRPLTAAALSRHGTSIPDWEDQLYYDLGVLAGQTRYITPNVVLAELF